MGALKHPKRMVLGNRSMKLILFALCDERDVIKESLSDPNVRGKYRSEFQRDLDDVNKLIEFFARKTDTKIAAA
jgi:hypothetical protein